MMQLTQAKPANPLEVFESFQRLVQENNPSGIADLMAVDGTIEYPFAVPHVPQRLHGREEIRASLTRSPVASLMEVHKLDQVAIHETHDPEVIVVEYSTHGKVLKTGRLFQLPAIAVIRVRNGQIVSYRDYISPLAGAQTTGRLPELFSALTGTGPERAAASTPPPHLREAR